MKRTEAGTPYFELPRFLMFGWTGAAWLWFILIRRGLRSDHKARVLAHEDTHIGQAKRDGPLRFLYRYVFKPKHRFEYEARAYAVSAAFEGRGQLDYYVGYYATVLHTRYWLKKHYTHEDCVQRIKQYALELLEA